MLNIKNLRLQSGAWQRDYTQQIATGSIVTLQGRSGLGKSSLLAAIAGFIQPTQGELTWQGQSLLPLAIEQRPVSLLFQEHNLFEHLSIWHNICLGLAKPLNKEAIEQAAMALEVYEQLNKYPPQLSGGQRQRIALLRTLLRPEPLVLLDEPFAELDDYTRDIATRWVQTSAKAQQKTVLLVTHQQEDVARLADENWVLV